MSTITVEEDLNQSVAIDAGKLAEIRTLNSIQTVIDTNNLPFFVRPASAREDRRGIDVVVVRTKFGRMYFHLQVKSFGEERKKFRKKKMIRLFHKYYERAIVVVHVTAEMSSEQLDCKINALLRQLLLV